MSIWTKLFGTRSHTPQARRRLGLEQLDDRALPSVTLPDGTAWMAPMLPPTVATTNDVSVEQWWRQWWQDETQDDPPAVVPETIPTDCPLAADCAPEPDGEKKGDDKAKADLLKDNPYKEKTPAELQKVIDDNAKNNDKDSPGNLARYVRYVNNGGQQKYDDWFDASRGGRSGDVNHQAIQNRLGKEKGARTEVPIGNRGADVEWPKTEDSPRVIHQIGGVNPGRGDPIARERRAIEDIVEELKKDKTQGDTEIWFWDKDKPDAKEPVLKIKVSEFPPKGWVPGTKGDK
jgi:hypothetical protein